MAELQDKIEIERVTNLVQGFGWKVSKQELTNDEIIMELKKPRTDTGKTPEPGPG